MSDFTDQSGERFYTDPETGEVLATEATRELEFAAALADYAEATIEMGALAERAERAKRAALTLYREGDRPIVRGERVFAVEMVKPPRQPDKPALDEAAEQLPDKLRPKEVTETTTRHVYPGVRGIEAERIALARAGFLPDDFLVSFEPRPTIKVLEEKGA